MDMGAPRFISAAVNKTGRLIRDDDPEAILPWWSFTKTVLAACVMARAREGFLDLDAPMAGQSYSLRHLLAHTAGLKDYAGLGRYRAAVEAGHTPWSPAQLMEEARADDMLWKPGKGWRYSNIGYMQLRFALEVSEGADMGTIIDQRILSPLGLRSTYLAKTVADMQTCVWDSKGYHPGWVYHGCLMGPAREAALIMHALAQGDIVQPEDWTQMTTLHMQGGGISGRVWRSTGYGLGLMIGQSEPAGPAIGHAGCGPFSGNLVAHFPHHDVTVASFSQGGDETPAEWEACRIARDC